MAYTVIDHPIPLEISKQLDDMLKNTLRDLQGAIGKHSLYAKARLLSDNISHWYFHMEKLNKQYDYFLDLFGASYGVFQKNHTRLLKKDTYYVCSALLGSSGSVNGIYISIEEVNIIAWYLRKLLFGWKCIDNKFDICLLTPIPLSYLIPPSYSWDEHLENEQWIDKYYGMARKERKR